MQKTIAVTGGAGFIGSHLVDRLIADGASVRVIDDLSTGLTSNLPLGHPDFEFFEGSINDSELLERIFGAVDAVVHLAALGSVPRSVADPVATHTVNATGTLQVLAAAKSQNVSRVVFSSSSSVYGDEATLPKVEHRTGNVLSPYAASKLHAEHYCSLFGSLYGLSVVRLRFFNVFGPRQRADHVYAAVIPKFIDASLRGESLQVHGDGLQSRDFTYIDNTVDGIRRVLDAGDSVSGEVFNLACGDATTLMDLIEQLSEIRGEDVKVDFTDPRAGDVRHSLADIAKLSGAVSYTPCVSVSDGLVKTYEWFRSLGLLSS